MEDARARTRLWASVKPIGAERLIEGWAAHGTESGPAILGLILVTDQRLVFTDAAGGMMAFPIRKVSKATSTSPCGLSLTAWFGRMSLTFDTPGALSSMLSLVRQNPAWTAVESIGLGHSGPLMEAFARGASGGLGGRLGFVGDIGAAIAPLEAA